MWNKILQEVSFEIRKLLNQLNKFCHSNNWIKLIVNCPKTILKVLKKHITGRNFHKKFLIITSIQHFFLSEKLIKLSKFWFTVLKVDQKAFVLLKEGQEKYSRVPIIAKLFEVSHRCAYANSQ